MVDQQASNKLQGLVSEMIKAIVDGPNDVKVEVELKQEQSIRLHVTVAPNDLGKVIGKNGRMARLLRTFVAAASRAAGFRCELGIDKYVPLGRDEE